MGHAVRVANMADIVNDDAVRFPASPPDRPDPRNPVGITRLDLDGGAPQERDAKSLQASPVPISELVPRHRAKLRGQIRAVSFHLWPANSYKVELNDGTGTVFLRFVGRRSLPGFEPGRWLSVEGTPAETTGQLVLLNPIYSFLPDEPQPE